MNFLNDFGIDPRRGNAAAAGIDFFVPDPRKWNNEQRSAYAKYARSKYGADIEDMDGDELTAFFLWKCHLHAGAESFEEWKRKYYDDGDLRLDPLHGVLVPTGIRTKFADNNVGVFLNKSSMGIAGLSVLAQVIDKDYTGYVHANLRNVSDGPVYISPGQKITQLLEMPVDYAEPSRIGIVEYERAMSGTQRGDNMAGSTGLTA